MRALIQRVLRAQVDIDGKRASSIGPGLCVFLGVGPNDTTEQADKLQDKIVSLRIFEDAQGKTNLSVRDVGGELLVVSQFTLYANCKKGKRPSFAGAARPELADALYEHFVERARQSGVPVSTGSFGAMMQVSLVNDGPFTIWLDTDSL